MGDRVAGKIGGMFKFVWSICWLRRGFVLGVGLVKFFNEKFWINLDMWNYLEIVLGLRIFKG